MNKLNFKSWINEMPEYVAGRTLDEIKEKYGLKEVYKLASNENIFGPNPVITQTVCKSSDMINYYPDSMNTELINGLSNKYGVDAGNIIIGNGTDQIIEMACDVFIGQGDNIVIPDPTFLIYEKSALKCGGRTVKVGLKKDFSQDVRGIINSLDDRTKIIFLTNPHNPTGTCISCDEIRYCMEKIPENILVVMDEAYYEYFDESEAPDTIGLLKENDNLLLLRTFSKIYGLAGLRVGYGLAGSSVIEAMNKIRLPFNVNLIAQKAASAALKDDSYVRGIREKTFVEKEKICKNLRRTGIEYVPSYSNFLLIKTGKRTDNIVEDLLVGGFIVRPGKNLGFKDYIRVTVSKPEINDLFIKYFIELYKKYSG